MKIVVDEHHLGAYILNQQGQTTNGDNMFRVVSRFTGEGFLYHGTDLAAAREAARADADGPVSQYRTEVQQYLHPLFDEPGWYPVEYFN